MTNKLGINVTIQCEDTEIEPIPSSASDVSIIVASSFGVFTGVALVVCCMSQCSKTARYTLSDSFNHDTKHLIKGSGDVNQEDIETILRNEEIEMASTFGTVITPYSGDMYALEDPHLEELHLHDITNDTISPEEGKHDSMCSFPPSCLPSNVLSLIKVSLFSSIEWFSE